MAGSQSIETDLLFLRAEVCASSLFKIALKKIIRQGVNHLFFTLFFSIHGASF